MPAIFESILPIFLLVVFGAGLKRSSFIDAGLWSGLEQLGYFVLFPALLFQTLYKANFTGLAIETVALAALLSIALMSVLLLALWPALCRSGVSRAAFTTVFQTSSRWNAFIALAIGQKIAGSDGLALVALVMAVIVVPINFINVGMLVWFSHSERNWATLTRRIVTNPLILGCLAGLAMRLAPVQLYGPADAAVELLARSALGLGLIMVGAGLRLQDALKPSGTVVLPIALKLLVLPAVMVGICVSPRHRRADTLSDDTLRQRSDRHERLRSRAADGRRRATLCGGRDAADRRFDRHDTAGSFRHGADRRLTPRPVLTPRDRAGQGCSPRRSAKSSIP